MTKMNNPHQLKLQKKIEIKISNKKKKKKKTTYAMERLKFRNGINAKVLRN